MNITIIGTGYVGLVTGACFAEMGYHVTCVDTDAAKIQLLNSGVIPIYEEGLEAIVTTNLAAGRLQVTTSLAEAMPGTSIFFISVSTPSCEDGSADLTNIYDVAQTLGRHLDQYAVVVDKSTAPVGTAEQVRDIIAKELATRDTKVEFDVVCNPEFLKQGAAVADFMKPDRIVIGTDSDRAAKLMHRLYAPFIRNHERMIYMGVRDAEMTKYAANAMLATKISFINEIAALCDRLNVDVENVRLGIGSDQRIGFDFIYPGCGYGGHCFPKDVKALVHSARQCGLNPQLLQAVDDRNQAQRRILFEKITNRFGHDLFGLTFGIWGLAFKPGTDDLREAPSAVLIEALIHAGARVRAFDPAAMQTAKLVFPTNWQNDGHLTLVDDQYSTLQQADALVLVTEWKPFRNPDYPEMLLKMKQPVIFDGRNQYDPDEVKAAGFEYFGIGRRG